MHLLGARVCGKRKCGDKKTNLCVFQQLVNCVKNALLHFPASDFSSVHSQFPLMFSESSYQLKFLNVVVFGILQPVTMHVMLYAVILYRCCTRFT